MKMPVHNLCEARALIKEMNARGEFHEYIQFYTHDGKLIGSVTWNESRQEIELL